MSLVFIKSADDRQQSTRHNPNSASRFSNYLTQPMKLPPNSQVSYVSSQFSISADGVLPPDESYMLTSDTDNSVLDQAVKYYWSSDAERTTGGIQQTLSNYTHSANEAEMDSDYTNTKYVDDGATGTKGVPNYGHIAVYDSLNRKAILTTLIRPTIDQYNLDFNCSRSNPDYLGSAWAGGGGATVPPGLNFTDKVDSKFQGDCRLRKANSPNGALTFQGGNCYGYAVGEATGITNARPRVYAGGANFYNTGYSAEGLRSSAYEFGGGKGASEPLPSFSDGNYGIIMNTTGIKKSLGFFTPSTNPQQSNGGGHQTIQGSGGYVVITQSNIDQLLADGHYTAANVGVGNEGFTGYAPQFIGIHSVPYIQQRGFDEAIKNGIPKNTALYDIDTQIQNWLPTIDLNKSPDSVNAVGGDARYLFGMDIIPAGTAPDVDLICVPKVLDTINGKIKNSQYVDLTQNNSGVGYLSIKELSKGTNTAVEPPYEFDSGANYSINTYNTDVLKTPASLFFRFRWENKNQICIEFTLNVEGVAGGYNPATDEPYAPATLPPAPVGNNIVGANIDVRLDNDTNGSIINLGSDTITFLDSGGAGAPYNPNEIYEMVFVSDPGQTPIITMNDMDIEMSNAVAFDRMGIQTSPDGVTWTNVNIVGFNNMIITNNPFDPDFTPEQEYVGGNWTGPDQENGGWIVPSRPSIFEANGGVMGQEYNLGQQYMRVRWVSDGSAQQQGWNITIKSSAALVVENDPRDKWCFLGRMNLTNIQDSLKYYIPTTMGDCTVVSYPVAPSTETEPFRILQKGYFNVRQSNRFFQANNNFGSNEQGISYQPAPFTADNIFFKGADSLGVLAYDQFNPTTVGETSLQLINAEYDGTPPTQFNNDGILSNPPLWLGSRLGIDGGDFKSFRATDGNPIFGFNEPLTEMAYVLGFLSKQDYPIPISLEFDSTFPDGSGYDKQGKNVIQPTNESFSNHYQITNLPITSQNGVVSSQTKTIYIANSLCINDIQDEEKYRYYCDKTPFPIWIDLNNLEEIQLNKIDILITKDNNTEQTALEGESQIVLQFRQKETGTLPNSIPVKSMPFTRTY